MSDKRPIIEEGGFPWSPKKICCLINILLFFVFLALLFLPFHQTVMERNEAGEVALVNWTSLIPFIQHLDRNALILFVASSIAYLLVGGFALRWMIMSFLDKDPTTDKEDKYFVYGHFVMALSNTLFALLFTSYSDWAAMAMYIFAAIYYFVFIYIHYKKLTYY